MYSIDSEKAQRILVTEFNYKPSRAKVLLKDFPLIHEELKPAVDTWLETRDVLDVSIEGISISDVMKNRRAHFLVAVRQLNRLLDDDLSEEEAKRYKEIISNPAVIW